MALDDRPPISTERLFLTGYRGTGKTTVAGLLAPRLGWGWIDTDRLVEEAAGKTIADIFRDEGEPAFRDLEEKSVAEACGRERVVIALGGGAILRESTRRRLRGAGPVVGLTADAATLARRIAADGATAQTRPGLTKLSGLAEVEKVLADRAPLYREVADLEVSTEGRSPEQIAQEIAEWLAHPP